MAVVLDRCIQLLVDFIAKVNAENKDYWNKVKSDETHFFYICCSCLKDCIEDKRIELFRGELRAALLDSLKTRSVSRDIYFAIISNDEDLVNLDLKSNQSIILQNLVDLVKFSILVYAGNGTSCHFSPCLGLKRYGLPLVIQWSSSHNRYIQTDLHHDKTSKFEETEKSKLKRSHDISKNSEKTRKKRKIHMKHKFKSREILSSTDSSDSDEEVKVPTPSSSIPKNVNNESDSSINNDLCVSDTDEYEDKEKSGDFYVELDKLKRSVQVQELEGDLKNNSKFDSDHQKKEVQVNISEAAKNLQEFSPFSVLYQENIGRIESNISKFLEVTERLRKHALVLQSNLLPENIETCLCCPIHCAQALVKATKDKRGPKKKKI